MNHFSKFALKVPRILLPSADIDPQKWAVVACDQYTSQPEWWREAERIVGDCPSTLKLIYPECYLSERPVNIPVLHGAMREAQKDALTRAVDGFILVKRATTCGNRLGLVVAIDLEDYDYAPGARCLIRATEGTVIDRLPPRMAIRRGAPLELPHVMLLVNDPDRTLIEPLYERRGTLKKLYDFDLMQGGGHLTGWAVEDEGLMDHLLRALEALHQSADGFLFAVGDGNHSLAAARGTWLEIKEGLREEEKENHPARYALAELVNLYDPALQFEPIHRAVFGADGAGLAHDFILYCRARGMSVVPCERDRAQLYLLDEPLAIENALNPLPVAVLQPFLDEWLAAHPESSIDYIHGEDVLERLSACRIRLMPMDKKALFPAVRASGALPRKTFSMGQARDKRYYFEARSLTD